MFRAPGFAVAWWPRRGSPDGCVLAGLPPWKSVEGRRKDSFTCPLYERIVSTQRTKEGTRTVREGVLAEPPPSCPGRSASSGGVSLRVGARGSPFSWCALPEVGLGLGSGALDEDRCCPSQEGRGVVLAVRWPSGK